MSARMQFPLSQRRHTNIAVVRYTRNGVKLEIACYKNKVISYRSGLEDRLDEVLQVERIFTNVGRGYVAPEKDIAAVFGPEMSEQEAIKYILVHGEVQVAQQERTAEVDEMFKDIALIITQKCVNAETQRPFPTQVIEQALRTMGAGVKLDQPVKKQALSLMHQLVSSHILPIVRANMKLRCNTTTAAGLEQVQRWCEREGAEVLEVQDPRQNTARSPGVFSLLLLAQPHLFRELDRFVKDTLPQGSTLHTVDTAVTEVGEAEAGAAALRTRATTTCSSSLHGTSEADLVASPAIAARHTGQGKENAKDSQEMAGHSRSNSRKHGGEAEKESDDDAKAAKKSKRNKEQKRKKDKQQTTPQHDNDDTKGKSEGDHAGEEAEHISSALAAVSAELQKLGLDPRTECREDDESEDEHGGKHKAKNKKAAAARKKRTAPPKQPQPQQPAAAEVPENSDEELEGNRRQRKNAKKKEEEVKAHAYYDDEEDFDYGDEEEDEAEEAQKKTKEEEESAKAE